MKIKKLYGRIKSIDLRKMKKRMVGWVVGGGKTCCIMANGSKYIKHIYIFLCIFLSIENNLFK